MIITLMIVIGARERHRRHRDARDERRDDARARARRRKYRRIGLDGEIPTREVARRGVTRCARFTKFVDSRRFFRDVAAGRDAKARRDA